MTAGGTARADLVRGLECCWHPVCTVGEVDAAGDRPVATRLLGHDLAVARLGDGSVVALDDRCAHRSTRLSIGCVDGDAVRCAHHGWAYGADGACVRIPSMPGAPIPARASVGSHATALVGGLVWVRLDPTSELHVPWLDGPGDATLDPYEWPVAAARRIEAAIDLWSDGTSVRFDDVHRGTGEVRFRPAGSTPRTGQPPVAFRVVMPFTLAVTEGDTTWWLTAAPVDEDRCRCFTVARGPGAARLAERLAADARRQAEVVVDGRTDGRFPLDAHEEVSVRGDVVSNVYRRWLRELAAEARRGGARSVADSLRGRADRPLGATG